MATTEGDEIGGWRLLSKLGSGHFSPVWKAQRGDEIGALKPAEGSDDSLARLIVEAEALAAFEHDGIPRLLDSTTSGATPYLVMEEAPGETLLNRVNRWNERGRVHGEIEALEVVTQLMAAVEHIHSRNRVHRDIKDANIIVDGEKVTLIDFGFCKPAGTRDFRTRDSFWRAGAARFGPLQKLEDPSYAVPGHDVYAVGVIAYRLLTGQFPYGEEDDLSFLKQRYADMHPATANEVNRMVSLPFSRLIDRMIDQNDARRISSHDALESLRELGPAVENFAKESNGSVNGRLIRARRTRFQHVIRDPIAGDIRITDLEYQVLGSKEMQRLRWMRQLGLTNLVYPGADHSRLSHSIGTVHTAETMMRAIEDESGVRIDPDARAITRLYALTHDVSHIALGHTIEDQLGLFVRHDENQGRFARLTAPETSDLYPALASSEHGRAVLNLLDPSKKEAHASVPYQVVTGAMGADVLDYIDRDAYFCGLDHRIDSAVYRQLSLDGPSYSRDQRVVSQVSGKYGIRTDRKLAIDHLLDERYAMFLKVYTHSAKIAADALLGKALSGLGNLNEPLFESFGDETLLDHLARSKRAQVAEYASMLRERRLPRGVFRTRLAEVLRGDRDEAPTIITIADFLNGRGLLTTKGRSLIEGSIAKQSGVAQERIFVYVPNTPPGHQRADHWVSEGVRQEPHQATSDLSRRHLNLWEAWVFVDSKDPNERKRVGGASQLVIGLQNMIDLPGDSSVLI